jgi:DNA-binding LytR/AlgR family response regulator
MKIAVIEDKKPHRDLLVHYLEEWRRGQERSVTVEAFGSGESFWFRYEEERDYDVLILDIQMPGINGMELARRVREADGDIVIVFATGVSDYLEEGYEVEALHYLVKPLSQEKLERCMEKALKRRRQERFVTVHGGEGILKISQERINYVEARGRGCCVGRVKVPEELEARESLSEMEGLLEPEEFMKCHRSYLCRIGNIRRIDRGSVEFDDGSSIPVSRRLYQQVNRRFMAYFRRKRCIEGL